MLFTFLMLWVAIQPKLPVKPVAVAPIAYFESKCARCHGSGGSLFGEEFGKGLDDDALTAMVRRMASGPAQSPISGDDLEAQIAYQRSLMAKEPFVAWTGVVDGSLVGEVTVGSKVSATRLGKSIPIKLVKGRWEIDRTSHAGIAVTAIIGIKKTTLRLEESNSSHRRKNTKSG